MTNNSFFAYDKVSVQNPTYSGTIAYYYTTDNAFVW